jgi:hypothetical protein
MQRKRFMQQLNEKQTKKEKTTALLEQLQNLTEAK